ncbi:hypothetical protein PP175_22300 [Aneurinibacillus sp. Ricciae_BoGa-3]|uniref:hypothetical protein n=1 Tax=Aneurinibacillus sp. Ricciae_BoGa-3 TaxID=3022697 RepID=UPI00234216D9|nr:hypothetical protein [Aneurinibacillus sp. Ricciae_BoGa-3]WCK54017.1 hypothetical protein PP175_22300 [Aneurinibacillus sp. Ricciae_BoGa-3]
MKKLLTLASAGVAVLAIASSAYAATTSTTTSTGSTATAATQQAAVAHQHKGQFNNQQLLTLLNVDATTLQQDLKAGKSLADIASAQGVDEQKVIDLLVSQQSQRLDQALQSGKLTQDQVTKKKADLQSEIKNRVEHKGEFGFEGKHGDRGGQFKDAASVLGMNPQDVLTQLKSGKSLAQIAQSKGISETDLVNQLLQKDKDRLTKMVEQTWNQKQHRTNADGETNDAATASSSTNTPSTSTTSDTISNAQ